MEKQKIKPSKADIVEKSIDYLNLIYQQNIQQKETRDKWFRYYLLLIVTPMGLIATISQTKILSSNLESFYLFLSLTSLFFFVLGLIFLTIYIKQRQNYVKSNRLIKDIEENIVLPYIWDKECRVEKYSKQSSKRTADYFANLVYIFLNSVWSTIFYVATYNFIYFSKTYILVILLGASLTFCIVFLLQVIYRFFLLKEQL